MPKIDAVNSMTVEEHSALRYANNYANYISKSCDMFLDLELNSLPLTLGSEYCKSAVFPGY